MQLVPVRGQAITGGLNLTCTALGQSGWTRATLRTPASQGNQSTSVWDSGSWPVEFSSANIKMKVPRAGHCVWLSYGRRSTAVFVSITVLDSGGPRDGQSPEPQPQSSPQSRKPHTQRPQSKCLKVRILQALTRPPTKSSKAETTTAPTTALG